jgi:hypothetical protein
MRVFLLEQIILLISQYTAYFETYFYHTVLMHTSSYIICGRVFGRPKVRVSKLSKEELPQEHRKFSQIGNQIKGM